MTIGKDQPIPRSWSVTRGLLRLWIALSILWLATVAYVAWSDTKSSISGKWQMTMEVKSTASKPWEAFERNKPFYETFKKPSEFKNPIAFSKIDYRYIEDFNKSAGSGIMEIIEFPNDTELYLFTSLGEDEKQYSARKFWETRWQRFISAIKQKHYLLYIALIPPATLLMIGFVIRWIAKGFRTQ